MKTKIKIMGLCIMILLLISAIPTVSESGNEKDNNSNPPYAVPEGYMHRPIVEFFTGLGCPSCMGGPHQDMDKLWEENRDNPAQPFTFVAFHLQSGKGGDDLAIDESLERARHYQPGISFTPDAEFDGGYIKLTGSDITYDSANDAIEDCKTRYEPDITNPLETITNDFKFVDLRVDQVFTGDGFAVSVSVQYLGQATGLHLPNEPLRGSLYVFMVEDDVTAYSTALEKDVLNSNVFRGYAIKDEEFTLQKDEVYDTTVVWEIPDTVIPITPYKITAVAAVFDLDDTTSQEGAQGNKAHTPRCVQSATPSSTAFDENNDVPTFTEIKERFDGKIKISAKIDDKDGISRAFVLYNKDGKNSTNWAYAEMQVSGDEICDDSGVCYAYTNTVAEASIPAEEGEKIYYIILAYDGHGVNGSTGEGKTDIMSYTAQSEVGFGGNYLLWAGGLVFLIFTGMVVYKRKRLIQTWSKHKKVVTVLAIVVIIILAFTVYSAMNASGKKAPDFTLTDTGGNKFSLSDYKGKVVVLDFMATWCSGCKAIMDDLKEVHNKYPDVVIISIDVDSTETNEELEEFKNNYNADWAFAIDTAGVGEKYSVVGIPKTVIINPSGEIAFTHVGEISASELSTEIEKAEAGGVAWLTFTGLGLPVIALIAGMLSFFSPCSFPLLPGYMAYYVGREKMDKGFSIKTVKKGLLKGIQPALGILIFYTFIGILAIFAGNMIKPYIPIFEPIVGGLIIILGIVMIANIPLFSKMSSGFIGRVSGLAGKEKRFGLFFYGIVYGAAAAGCTAPVFIAIILLAVSAGGFLWGMTIFLLYAIGMAGLMIIITILIAMSEEMLLQKLKISTKHIEKISGVILIIVGIYLIYYYLTIL
ncbi:MAG: redoxin domain-containing protein [Candidatus Thermoplasmatota archaeon]|nr:redoxin domain-containing protein [Candidatus Thermoplasmatota archaeon]MBU4256754.1 redoxin domain-containing protein [Candidatus Thermoplasmatota archaeon]MCG2826992.1 redoxin domain-containing protein [Thermoplasmatales archaeon]